MHLAATKIKPLFLDYKAPPCESEKGHPCWNDKGICGGKGLC